MNSGLFRLRPVALAVAALVAASGVSTDSSYAKSPVYFQTYDHDGKTSTVQVSDPPYLVSNRALKGSNGDALGVTGRYIVRFSELPVPRYFADQEAAASRGSSGAFKAKGALGRLHLDSSSGTVQNYVQQLSTQQQTHLDKIKTTLGKSPSVFRTFKYALNAVVLENLSSADVLKLVDLSNQPGSGIVSVRPEYIHRANTDIGPGFIGASSIWHGTPAGQDTLFADGFEGGVGFLGDGVVIGDIDTGYNSLSPSFAAVDGTGYHIQNPLGSGNFVGDCAGPNAATINLAGGCNDKVIGAYDFLNVQEPSEPADYVEDSILDGHGSHTGSTAGGNGRSATHDGYTAQISGVAPHANLVIYRGLYDGSGLDANLAAAAEQAIQDGIVDAINYSISGQPDPWDDPVSLAFLSATDAGIFVAAAAGNTGTNVPVAVPGTVDNIEPWVISAAASTHTGGPLIDNLVITGPAPAPNPTLFLSYSGTNFSGFLAAVPSSPLLVSAAFNNNSDLSGTDGCSAAVDGGTGYAGGTFTNAVAVISRGTCAFGDKVLSAQNAGAVAVIISDNRVEDPAVQSLTVDDTANSFTPTITIPVFFVSQADGTALHSYLTANTGIAAAIPTNSRRYAVQPDVLASFSLLGPADINVIKPDIQAPGVAIIASVANDAHKQGPDTVAFFSGTSMATPHTTGTGALLMGLHPDWTPAEVKSAIMMTATEAGLTKPNATTPSDFFDRGSGRIQAFVASKAGLVMNETGLNFSNANPATGGDPGTLNLASMQSSSCITITGSASTATCGFTRKFRSTQDHSVTWTVSFTGDVVATAASSLVVAAHANSQPLQISVDASTKNDGNFHFGEMILTPNDSTLATLHLPMAIRVPPPTIAASPSPLPVSITTGTTGSNTLVVKNIGGPTLHVTNTNDTTGSAGVSTVLLNQTRTGNNGFYSDFWDDQGSGAFPADDFATSVPDTNLSKLSFPGFTLQPGSSLAANVGKKIHFEVYGDASGIPNGNPQTAAPSYVWNYVATIGTTAGLTVTGDTIAIDLNAAGAPQTHLAAGTYWIVVYFDAATFGVSGTQANPNGWLWFESNAANGSNAHNIDPGLIFDGATGTWEDNVADGALSGMAMHIEVSASCGAPWLSASPGTLSIGASLTSNLTVNADSTAFPGGLNTASAFLCLDSNDPAHPVFAVPVTATSTANNPVANITPTPLSLSVNAGASGNTPLHIGNTGGGTLNWSITEAPAALIPVTKNSVTARSGGTSTQVGAFRLTSSGLSTGPRTPAIWAPKGPADPVMFQADDGTYENAISLNDGTTQFPALWLNRFAATGALTINAYSIEWPNAATAGGNVVGKSIDLVAYYDADADGDPSNAVRLGSDTLITISSTDAFENYPVNFHVPGAGDVYLGFEDAFASGGTSPILFATAIDEDADPDVGYVSGVAESADPDLNNLANNDLTGSIDSLTGGGITGAWMVRATATLDSGGTGGCQSPSDVPWLSESPTSGSVGAGLSQDSTITVDASSLAAGSYSAHVCVMTNDTTHALVDVPVNVTVTGTTPVTHTVTPSVGTPSGTITPNTPQTVNDGSTTMFTLAADPGFHIDTVGGTCGGTLAGSAFTTAAVTADCTVIANFTANAPVTHIVTPSVGTPSGTITPNTPQTVNDGSTTIFNLAANSGFHIDTVGGTCGGTLAGSAFTTAAVTADCTVIANFTANTPVTHIVTPSVGTPSGTITPNTPQTVNDGSTTIFNLAANSGFHIGTVGGTCGGSLAGSTYTTNAVTADCTVIANFAADVDASLLYSNIGTDAGDHLINGAATTTGTTRFTPMSCSKLTLAQPGPQLITEYSWAVYNGNATATTTSITTSVTFYDDGGASGGPGTRLLNSSGQFIGGGNFGIAYTASSATLNGAAPLGFLSTQVPAGVQNVWACTYFSGAASQTAAMANLGLEKYTNAPTAGSTTDLAFVTTSTTGSPSVDNPAGNFVTGSGTANVFGWKLVTVGPTALLDTYYNKNAAGSSVAGTGLALNSATGVGRNFAGYAATVAAPAAGSKWQITGLSLYPLCNAAATFTDTKATIQFWDTFNGTGASDVFGNSTPIATTTVDLGPQTCPNGSTLFFSHLRLPTPITVVGTSGALGITVQYAVDTGSGLVAQGDLVSTLGTAAAATPLPAVGSNASTNGWYKSADNRADLNFTGGTANDYVSTTRQSIVIQAYGTQVSAGPVTHLVTPSVGTPSGTITPNTPQTVNDGTTTIFTLAADPGFHINTVGGTCGGTLAGSAFTTAAVTADCTVIANFAPTLVAPTLTASFAPNTYVSAGSPSTLTLTLANSNATAATLTADLTDNLPTSVVVAATPNAATTCSSGTVSATAGAASFSLGTGAQIPANSTCTVKVDVSSTTAGVYTDAVAAGALQTDAGNNAGAASDNVVVAGTFPVPYCTKTFSQDTQPISLVQFAGINNTSSAAVTTGTTNDQQDFTTSVSPGQVGQTGYYTITVKANTDGNFGDFVRVYFDWNHDGVFNEDASERFDVGSITNSTGADTVSATGGVFVPATARSGLTRMRVVHDYGSASGISACDSTLVGQYGQTEDYLVKVDPNVALPPAPPFVSKAFSPNYVASGIGGISTLTITLTNVNAAALATTAVLTDTFPTGLVVAPTPNASTTCGGSPGVTATAGGTSVALGSGASIPGSGTCTVNVDVTTATGGIYVNTIAVGAAQSANGNSPNAASATVQFASASPTYSVGFESPFTAATINGQQGWFSANASAGGTQSTSTDWKVVTAHPDAATQELRATWTSNTGFQSFALTPEFSSGTSQYSSATARFALTPSATGTGATFDFAPQDNDSGSVITRVRFLKSGTAGGTSGKIQVLDPNAVSTDGYTDTGATWSGSTTANSAAYFTVQVVSNRNASTFAVCVNGTSIWTGPGFAANVNDVALIATKGSGTAGNAMDVDNLVIDNLNTDSGCTPPAAQSGGPSRQALKPAAAAISPARSD